MAIRALHILAHCSAAMVAGAVLSAPAHADPIPFPNPNPGAPSNTDNEFLRVLSAAGIGDGRIAGPTDPVELGRSVCPMLVEPGKNFASVVTKVRNDGVPPEVAAFFTGIAIQMYCPQMVTSMADGSMLKELRGR